VGSGLDESNCARFASADGAIVGTALKRGGDVGAEVDQGRVERIVRAFKGRDEGDANVEC
jgi:predicted TIM-barrel enzyme